jgi:HSP20 family protein
MAETATNLPVNVEKSKSDGPAELRPFMDLRRQIDRLFDEVQWDWPLAATRNVFDIEPFWGGERSRGKAPAVDVAQHDKGYEVTAELPGLDVSNIDLKYADGVLTIKAEKKEEKEEKKKDYYLSERRYGSFQRSISLPNGIETDKIEAKFKNGVLTVTLPKTAEAKKSEKKITVKAA